VSLSQVMYLMYPGGSRVEAGEGRAEEGDVTAADGRAQVSQACSTQDGLLHRRRRH
jgi:hypothetical protein